MNINLIQNSFESNEGVSLQSLYSDLSTIHIYFIQHICASDIFNLFGFTEKYFSCCISKLSI